MTEHTTALAESGDLIPAYTPALDAALAAAAVSLEDARDRDATARALVRTHLPRLLALAPADALTAGVEVRVYHGTTDYCASLILGADVVVRPQRGPCGGSPTLRHRGPD